MRTVGWWMSVALLANAGCESCDFSFGPIAVTVTLSPEVPALVTVCAEDQPCGSVDTATDTGMSGEIGDAIVFVGWHGYVDCRQPAMDITVVADGCAPKLVSLPRQKRTDTSALVAITLDCN